MIRPVTVTVTNIKKYHIHTFPYYRHYSGNNDLYEKAMRRNYVLPLYVMYLEGDGEDAICQKHEFIVMRYGVRWEPKDNSDRVTGLSQAQTHTLRLLAHNQEWNITGSHNLHAGAVDPMLSKRPRSAVTGCVAITGMSPETIVDSAWKFFNDKVLELSGAKTLAEVAGASALKMVIHAAVPPKLPRASRR